MPLTPAQRKAAERRRRRAAGLVSVEVWIAPKQRERLRRYVAQLQREGK